MCIASKGEEEYEDCIACEVQALDYGVRYSSQEMTEMDDGQIILHLRYGAVSVVVVGMFAEIVYHMRWRNIRL